MTVNLSLLGGAGWQFSDNNGSPLSGGLLYTYQAGTTTPQATYTSNTGVTAQTNPIVLDSAGRIAGGEIWLTQGQDYKFVLKTSAGATIGTYDNVPGANDFSSLAAPTSSSLIGYLPTGTNAVATTVQAKLREIVSIADFGAVGDWNGSTGTDNTALIQNALNSGATSIEIPNDGTYAWNGALIVPSNVSLFGGQMFAISVAATIRMTGSNSVVRDVEFSGTMSDAQYVSTISSATSYFSSSSVLTDENFTPIGTLGAGKISVNALTLVPFVDTGATTTRVLSSKFTLNVAKRYVIDIENDVVTSGYIASQIKFRAYDAGGNLIVGSASQTVDANGVYNYTLPATYASGNYLFLENAAFLEVSFAVSRLAEQVAGNSCVFDMSKIKVYELINDFATLAKVSNDDFYVVSAEGTNNTIQNCTFKNLPSLGARARSSVNARLLNNTAFNCLSGFNVTNTSNTMLYGNLAIASFENLGQRAFRYKGFGGIDAPGLQIINNVSDGYFWGYEIISSASPLTMLDCSVQNNVSNSIATAFSFGGYTNTIFSGNSGNIGELGEYVFEFPGQNTNCSISNNTFLSTNQHGPSFGIAGFGAEALNPNTKISNNTITAGTGIYGIIVAPNTINDYQGIVISGNTINYSALGIFSNIGGILITENTLRALNIGSNNEFVRAACYVVGNSYIYPATISNNSIVTLDGYALTGNNVRLVNIFDNLISHLNSSAVAVSFSHFPAIPSIFKCLNNNFDIVDSTLAIAFTGTFVVGDSIVISGNRNSQGYTITPNCSFAERGSDPLMFLGNTAVTAGNFSVTLCPAPSGVYDIAVSVDNGDRNHMITRSCSYMYSVASVNTLNNIVNLQDVTTGTVITSMVLAVSAGNLVLSGTASSGTSVRYVANLYKLLVWS